MKFPSREIVESIRREYPAGTRVELVRMDDVQAPPAGTKGTVKGVDDTGSLLMRWDNGSGLNVVYGEDIVQKIPVVKTVCYGRTKEWYSRAEAEQFFFHAMMNSTEAVCENIYGIEIGKHTLYRRGGMINGTGYFGAALFWQDCAMGKPE